MEMFRHSLKSLLAAISSFVLLGAFLGAFLPAIGRAADISGPGWEHRVRPHVKQRAASDTVSAYSGRAYGAQVHVLLPLPATRLYADTGILASAGGSLSASLASITDAVFTSGPTSCSAVGSGTVATSASSMTNLSAFAGTAAALSCTRVSADASASCLGTSGSCSLSGLVFAGVSVVVTGAANQTVSVPGVATLVINEQLKAAGSITVNALHLTFLAGNELIICSAHSDIECATPTRRDTWGSVKAIYR